MLRFLDELAEDYEIDVQILQDAEPAAGSLEGSLMESLHAGIAATGGRAAAPTMCPGCLETRVYSRVGIPSVAYGPGPAARMHGPDESVPIDNLVEAATAYAYVLGDLLGYD